MKTLFFLGKGGTGKSTVACLSALTLADQGKSVVLVSLDDAHNLSDILGGGSRPWNIRGELVMVEVDRDREIRRFLARQTREIKASHTYLTAFNLDHHFNVLKHSPGMEVHALADAFGELRRKYASWDYLLVDMPPTALALHFFNLPSLSLVWLEQLEALRREIKEKKEIISRIKLGAKVVEQDRILTKIQELGTQHRELANFFRDTRGCQLLGVCNGDPLSRAESRRIMDGLASLDLSLGGLVLNLCDGKGEAEPDIPVAVLPRASHSLVGISALERYREGYLGDQGEILGHFLASVWGRSPRVFP